MTTRVYTRLDEQSMRGAINRMETGSGRARVMEG
jgi:hypothetical protein